MTYNNWLLASQLIPIELWNTIYMVFATALFSLLIGLPIGILLYLTESSGLHPHPWSYRFLNMLVNVGRSIPFAILMIALIPFTRFIIGVSLGTTAAIVPLTIGSIPLVARFVELSLKSVSPAIVEASLVMGSKLWHTVFKVLIPESLPTLIRNITTVIITIIAYSAMAGLVGGGGLGKVAIQYGYQRFNGFLMLITLIILLLLVQIIQWLGERIAWSIERKRGL